MQPHAIFGELNRSLVENYMEESCKLTHLHDNLDACYTSLRTNVKLDQILARLGASVPAQAIDRSTPCCILASSVAWLTGS
ncbi:La-related protein 1C [Zea mays]|jgi:hypothetical protein|uniref:La-related protein 1C n=1 Tax=Zea mays TaxID=4577 RepID=A0A1D6EU56_MAIZE|nr:La-related protein 1C [Zea mays]